MKFIIASIALSFLSLPSLGQGFYVSKYYSPKDYKAFPQNWDIEQDSSGFIHFANGTGLVTFDGKDWNIIHIGERGRGTSLYASKSGAMFTSGQYNFGYVNPDSITKLSYKSISDSYYHDNESFNPHFWTGEINDEIYFWGPFGLNILKGDSLVQFKTEFSKSFYNAFETKGQFYTNSFDGIVTFRDDDFFKVAGGARFINDELRFGTKLNNENTLLGFRDQLMFEFDGKNFTKFSTEVDDFLKKNQLYKGLQLNDSLFALATIYGGLVFINEKGKLEKIFNTNTGSHSNSIYDLYIDKEGILWMALDDGVQKIFVNIPISKYSANEGLEESVLDISIVDENILVWTSGKNVLENSISKKEQTLTFERLNTLNFTSKKIDNFDADTEVSYMISAEGISSNFKGVTKVLLSSNSKIGAFKGIKKDGYIYLLDKNEGVFKIENNEFKKISINNNSNLKTIYNHIGVLNNKVHIAVEGPEENSGIYQLNDQAKFFEKSDFLKKMDSDLVNKQVLVFEQCENGDIWLQNDRKIKRISYKNREWELIESPYRMIGDYEAIYSIKCSKNGVWFGGVNGLYHLKDPDWDYKTNFKTNITGIYVENDSLIYGGFGEPMNPIVLPYQDNELRFTYAAASYIDETRNTYQYKLDGYDSDWSDWSLETQKDYTNLREGEYTFMVRSRNIYEVYGEKDSILFTILPPWYRSWWAYILYILTVGVSIYLIYKIRINQILRVQRVRNRIADDLHDDLSGTLIGISNFAKAINANSDENIKNRFLGLIQKSADEAKEKISDIVWTINPEHDDWNTFLTKCRRHASDIFEAQKIEYSLEMDENISGDLDMELRKNLWLIFKEIITNITKHSKANYVLVRFKTDHKRLSILIKDNGKGFKIDTVEQGNGINSIKRRAEKINGEIELVSELDQGTFWNVVINL